MELWPKDDGERRRWCESQGIRPEHHCCLDMAFAISRPVLRPHQRPNRVVDWISPSNEYRIPISYDGYSSTVIRFCPWCGSHLSPSRRDEWYQVLWDMGYSDPGEDDEIPPEFKSDQWWRGRGENGASPGPAA